MELIVSVGSVGEKVHLTGVSKIPERKAFQCRAGHDVVSRLILSFYRSYCTGHLKLPPLFPLPVFPLTF